MNPLRKALFDTLSGDETLTGMLAAPDAIYHDLAPADARPPYIVFQALPGSRQWAFQGGEIRWPLWLFQSIDRSESSSAAEDVDARVDALLSNATFTIEGFKLLDIRRLTDVPKPPSADEGEIVHSVGGIYRIGVEPA